MDKQTIMNTMKFMERVDLKWNEVPAFNECIAFITELYNQEEKKTPKEEEFQDLDFNEKNKDV